MNVAKLELCKELHELSGWKDTDYTYYANAGQHSGAVWHRSQVFDKPENLPAYDLSYLLRKLPDGVKLYRENLYMPDEGDAREQWRIEPGDCEQITTGKETVELSLGDWEVGDEPYLEDITADTPEDVAAMLAIDLFKQDILQWETS